MTATELKTLLVESLSSAKDTEGRYQASLFFKRFYPRLGQSYFFLFKKNGSITNIQFGELLGLIRAHTHTFDSREINDLRFLSTEDFTYWIKELFELVTNRKSESDTIKRIVETYFHIFERTVVFDPFYCSAALFLPPHLTVDIALITALSGYIHSSGDAVFVRNIDKATRDDFYDKLDNYLERNPVIAEKRCFFSVYSEEDFSGFDDDHKADLKDGLADVKIRIGKFHVGNRKLVELLNEMKVKYASQLVVPDEGDYRVVHKEQREKGNVDDNRTLWLISDYSFEPNAISAAKRRRYLICYAQRYINENPLHIFDEDKPAWISATTIPHTLVAAMINLTSPTWPGAHCVTLKDPFVGTGTTWLETIKYGRVVNFSSDLSPVAPLLTRDNLSFFARNSAGLEQVLLWIGKLRRYVESRPRDGDGEFAALRDEGYLQDSSYAKVFDQAQLIAGRCAGSNDRVSQEDRDTLVKLGEEGRLVFYIFMRTRVRNEGARTHYSAASPNALVKQCAILRREIAELKDLRVAQESEVNPCRIGDTNVRLYHGQYSASCSLGSDTFDDLLKRNLQSVWIEVLDARKLHEESCKVVVADLPYGVNTEEEDIGLAELWSDALKSMISALMDDGDLVLCLPDRSNVGRRIFFFTHRIFVTQQVLSLAEQLGREVIIHADMVPRPTYLFRPPFYWESGTALRRSVLHFRLRIRRGNSSPK